MLHGPCLLQRKLLKRSGKDYYLWPLDTQQAGVCITHNVSRLPPCFLKLQERFCGEHSCERYAVGSSAFSVEHVWDLQCVSARLRVSRRGTRLRPLLSLPATARKVLRLLGSVQGSEARSRMDADF